MYNFVTRFLLTLSGVIVFSDLTATELGGTSEYYRPSTWVYSSTDRIDFGFVLLPDPSQGSFLFSYRDLILERLTTAAPVEETRDGPVNVPVTIPHISLGQYALLAEELPALQEIVNKTASELSPIEEPMSLGLVPTEYNLSFECLNLREKTNPLIIELYKRLREAFFGNIVTKQPTIRGLHIKFLNRENPKELDFLEKFYQNWNIPEDDRICPHFTLVYKHPGKSIIMPILAETETPSPLRVIRFTHLGIVAIDLSGNPLPGGLIHAVPLRLEK